MKTFQTWDEVVTYVYWQTRQLPPTDPAKYADAKDKIIAFHLGKGFPVPSEEANREDYQAEMEARL